MVQNISGPPTTKSNAIQNYPSRGIVRHEKKRLGPGGIVLLVGGLTLVVSFAAIFFVFSMKKVHDKKINLKIGNMLPRSLPLGKAEGESVSFLQIFDLSLSSFVVWCSLTINR